METARLMKVIYAVGSRFAGPGVGTVAYHAVRGLHQHGIDYQVICGSCRPTSLPSERISTIGLPSRALRRIATFDRSGNIFRLHSVIFDNWARQLLQPADAFYVWGNDGLKSIKKAKELGAIALVGCASPHPAFHANLLREEYARWELSFPVSRASEERAVAELSVADGVVIPSEFVRKSFRTEGFPDRKLVLVPFGTDTDRFHPIERPATAPFRVVFVGGVRIEKGVPYLLEAWRQLGWRDAELHVLGAVDPPARPLLRRWSSLGGVHMVGYRRDPSTFFQSADVFALPTIAEGSALVTYEALASGLPVVTTPNAGSVVRDGVEGFIVPIRDVSALARCLEQLRSDNGLRQEMAGAARKRAEHFTWQRYESAFAQALASLVRACAGGRAPG